MMAKKTTPAKYWKGKDWTSTECASMQIEIRGDAAEYINQHAGIRVNGTPKKVLAQHLVEEAIEARLKSKQQAASIKQPPASRNLLAKIFRKKITK